MWGLRMRREAPLGEDPEPSILIHSLFARRPAHVLCMSPRRGIIQYKPHYPIYRIITMKSLCQRKILQKIWQKNKDIGSISIPIRKIVFRRIAIGWKVSSAEVVLELQSIPKFCRNCIFDESLHVLLLLLLLLLLLQVTAPWQTPASTMQACALVCQLSYC